MSQFQIGQVWEQRDGDHVTITSISARVIIVDGDQDNPLKTTGHVYSDGSEHDYDLVTLIADTEEEEYVTHENPFNALLAFATESAQEGAKDGASAAATKKATQILKKKLGKNYPAFLKTEFGQVVEAALVPAILFLAAEMFPQLPYSDEIKEVAGHSLRGSVSSNTEAAIEQLIPLFEGVGAVIESQAKKS